MSRKTGLIIALVCVAASASLGYVWYRDRGFTKTDGGGEPREPLLARAIHALGGETMLSQVRTLKLRSKLTEHGRNMEVALHLMLPDRYRHDVETGDARLVHATDGKKAWASLDDVPVPLEAEEFQRLAEQMNLVQISLLVGLKDARRATTKEKGMRDGLEWLAAEFSGEGGGSYLLGFDPVTSLLARADWETRVSGQRRALPISVRLTNYRKEGGIMIPLDAAFYANEQVVATDRIESAEVNPEIDAAIFEWRARPETPPIQRRTLMAATNAMLAAEPDRADDAKKIMLAWMKDHSLERSGPVFEVIENGVAVAVGIPICADAKPVVPAAANAPALSQQLPIEALTTIVTPVTPEELRLAAKRLAERAVALSVEPAGPLRHVSWNEEITQVQLPIRARIR